MLILKAIIFAIVQGLTEFLPISSSGHLIILHDLLKVEVMDDLTFDVALHLGTAFAIIGYFWHDIKRYLIAFGRLFRSFNWADQNQKTVVNLAVATIPGVLAGIFLETYLESFFRNLTVIAIALIIGGVLFFVVERYSKQKLLYLDLSLPESFLIGCAQALALIPGVSRSGITIIAGMSLNLKREDAARFSFLLSVPIVLGAGMKRMLEIPFGEIALTEWLIFITSIIVSAFVGFLVIRFFLHFIQKRSLTLFAWYRILLGLAIVFWLWIK